MQSALQDEIDTLRRHYRSDRDPAGLVFASLADAYRRAGELDEAWSLLEEGLDEHPDFATGHLVAARVHRDRDELDEASERYTRVLELDPENTAALREKAALAQDRDRIEEALSLCQRLALLEPTDPDLRARIRELKAIHFSASTETEGRAEPAEVAEVGGVGLEAEADEEAEVEDVWGDAWYEGLPIPESSTADAERDEGSHADDERSEESGAESETAGEALFPEIEGEGGSEDETRVEASEWVPAETRAGEAERRETGTEETEMDGGPAVFTRTMADLYARQGHVERALDVYDHLLERNPDDQEIRDRIRELKERAGTPPDDEGPSIASYFEDLLAWEREE